MVDSVNVDRLGSNIAVVTFSDQAKLQFRLNEYDNRLDMKAAIDEIPYTHGTTNTAAALKLIREQVFQPNVGDRDDLNNVAILLTDGNSNDFAQTLLQARLAREQGITLITVGINDWINMDELREIASDPDDLNVFQIDKFDQITRLRNDIKAILCDREY